MNKDELRELLHQEYKTENWKKVTEFVFPNVQYLQRPQAIPFNNDEVESFKQIGNVKLNDGKNLAMFEVKVAQNVNLLRSRVKLRKLVENLIDQERNHGVLVIYEQGKEDYRFTFTAKSTEFDEEENDFVDLETDAKRFTYILGKNESCKTAANRFWELSTHKDIATIKDVENAFSVERLNKEFFNKYKEFYEDFVHYITGKRFVKEKGKWVEKKIGRAKPIHKEVFNSDDKLARNFVKLLLGRLVFIQFLQKKGWVGVPATSKQWKKGDPDFLLNLYNNAKSKDEFHSKCLYPLFYKAFNTPNRPNDVFALTGSRVPYLNGGLFENENPKTIQIDFKPELFAGLLEFFGQYNFTIDENDPLDHEVGIDPEMLGHIFENLLEDNKDKGAFYTPKPIVQYMCQESLIQYLKTYLQEHQIWPQDEEAANQTETHLQNFVRKKIAGELLNDYDEHLARALKEVKICDPAIGSGAFPMGLLNEIFYCMQVLHDASPDSVGAVWEMEEWAPDIVKKNIIQHSIYGVDIEKGAVDIARLRFWLSLIVDELEPTPLPNLDFKIMQGNSLLESYEGIDLSKIAGTKTMVTEVALDLFGNPVNAQVSIFDTKYIDDSNITELIDSYFNTQLPDEKQRLKKEIDNIIHKHIDYNLEFEENKILIAIAEIKKNLSFLKSDKNHSTAIAAKTTKAREKLTKGLEKEQENLELLKSKRKELHDLQKTPERPYFLWHLFFKDVFDNGGFDIVIGNPPYIQLQGMGKACEELERANYSSFIRTGDIYCLFYEQGNNLLKKKGVLNYITSNKWMNSGYGKHLRGYLLQETNPILLIDFSKIIIFPDAVVFVNILQFTKEIFSNQLWGVKVKSDYKKGKTWIPQYVEDKKVNINNLSEDIWTVADKSDFEITKQIELLGVPLKNWDIQFFRGITSGLNQAFHITNSERNVLIKADKNNKNIIEPLLRGKDIKRWTYTDENLYILNTHNGIREFSIPPINVKKDYPFVYKHLLQYYDEDSPKAIKNIDGSFQTLKDRADQGDQWFNLRNCAFLQEFKKEKIIWIEISDKANYCIDTNGFYLTNSAYFITGKDLKYLTALLNSKLMDFYFFQKTAQIAGGRRRYTKQYVELLPIIIPENRVVIKKLEKIVENIISKINYSDISEFENEIDLIVYKLYKLSYENVKVVDPFFTMSAHEYNTYKI